MRYYLALACLSLAMTTACSELTQPPAMRGSGGTLLLGPELEQAISSAAFRQITSVVVTQNDKLIYERFWEGTDSTHQHDTRSAMKTLVAMAVGAALTDNKLGSVNDVVFKRFDSDQTYRFNTPLKAEVTVMDLLTMSSALDCDDNSPTSPGNEERMYPTNNWTAFALNLPTKAGYQRDAEGRGPFAYCTVGSFLLGQLVQRATGRPVDEYIGTRLLNPLGIDDVIWDRSPSNEVMTGGGAMLTSQDLARLGQLLLNRGRWEDNQVLPATWVDLMLTKHRKANDRQSYGLQLWHEDFACGARSVDVWYMGGNGGNKVAVLPDLAAVIVITATLYGTAGMHQQSSDIIADYVLPSLPGCSS